MADPQSDLRRLVQETSELLDSLDLNSGIPNSRPLEVPRTHNAGGVGSARDITQHYQEIMSTAERDDDWDGELDDESDDDDESLRGFAVTQPEMLLSRYDVELARFLEDLAPTIPKETMQAAWRIHSWVTTMFLTHPKYTLRGGKVTFVDPDRVCSLATTVLRDHGILGRARGVSHLTLVIAALLLCEGPLPANLADLAKGNVQSRTEPLEPAPLFAEHVNAARMDVAGLYGLCPFPNVFYIRSTFSESLGDRLSDYEPETNPDNSKLAAVLDAMGDNYPGHKYALAWLSEPAFAALPNHPPPGSLWYAFETLAIVMTQAWRGSTDEVKAAVRKGGVTNGHLGLNERDADTTSDIFLRTPMVSVTGARRIVHTLAALADRRLPLPCIYTRADESVANKDVYMRIFPGCFPPYAEPSTILRYVQGRTPMMKREIEAWERRAGRGWNGFYVPGTKFRLP